MQVCRTVAHELDDPQTQASFLRTVNPPSDLTHRSGFLFQFRSDALQRPIAKPALCAVEHALIFALPERPRDEDSSGKTKRAK